MKEVSAYLLSVINRNGEELARLSDQAKLFLELELPKILPKIRSSAKVGDFGSGNGVITRAIAGALPDVEVWGLEADPEAVAQARQESPRPNLHFARHILGRETPLPLPSGPLDFAFARLVLLHLPDPEKAAQEMAQNLKPGGILYLVDGDDSLAQVLPATEWRDRVLQLMERVQNERGGSRNLGSKLESILRRSPLLVDQGSAQVRYSKRDIGPARFHDVFMPVIRFYLDQSAKLGLLDSREALALADQVSQFLMSDQTELSLCVIHAWARRKG